MDNEQTPTGESKGEYWNTEFERIYGDLLTEIIIIMHPRIVDDEIDNEKDIFYYKLQVLQALCDPSIKVGNPSTELTYAFGAGIQEGEFEEFKEQMHFIIESDTTSISTLTTAILNKCDAVIVDPKIVSFYFDFNPSKPRSVN